MKRLCCLFAIMAAAVLAASGPVSAQTLLRDFRLPVPLFSSESAWRQSAANAAILPDSERQILSLYRVLLGDRTYLHPAGFAAANQYPYMYLNHDDWTIPIFRMGRGQQRVLMRRYDGTREIVTSKLSESDEDTAIIPAPAGTIRPSGPQGIESDGHCVLFNPETMVEFDFWQATTARDSSGQSLGGGQPGSAILEAGALDFFSTQGMGSNPIGYSSARAVGVPLLAGLLVPEDVESGVIAHALACAIPGPRNTNLSDPTEPYASDYFYPASTTEVGYYSTDPYALAAGQRLRLKQTLVDSEGIPLDENQLRPITRMFITALRNYGAYVVDNGAFSFYAEDIQTATLNLTNDQVNALIGQPAGTALPTGKTKWQVVMEALMQDLELIPVAFGPRAGWYNPPRAAITTSNFEVVQPAIAPTSRMDIFASADGSEYAPGDTLSLSVMVESPGAASAADFYCGLLLPDGNSMAFFTDAQLNTGSGSLSSPASWLPILEGANLSNPLWVYLPSFLSYTWTGAEPPGSYLFFLFAAAPGAFGDSSVDAGDIEAAGVASFTFSPQRSARKAHQ